MTPPREFVVRAAALYVPVALAALLWWWRRPNTRVATAAFLACAWNAPALLVANQIAIAMGWWTFHATEAVIAGMPVDMYLGWIVLWGIVPTLIVASADPADPDSPARPVSLAFIALGAVSLDFVAMPACTPVVTLGDRWIVGEALAVTIALAPSAMLARWTMTGTHVGGRATLQAIAFTGLMLYVLTTVVLEQTGTTWLALFDRPRWWVEVFAQLLALPAVFGLSAVQEFATRGCGTPFPYDPPARLVTSGPYAYIGNPMQVAMCLVLLMLSAALGSWWLLAGSLVALAYGAGFAAWHEDGEIAARFGDDWTTYRRRVRRWLPRWRPPATGPSARVYLGETCGLCASVAAWLRDRHPVSIDIVAAERHPTRDLSRMTYVSADGCEEDGIAALARVFEHINLGWAWLGMLIRLPVVRPALQFLVDASGGGPRVCARRPVDTA